MVESWSHIASMPSTVRFLRQYLRPRTGSVTVTETTYRRGDERLEATVYAPPTNRPLPGWVVLHGLTARGRHHASLRRFARAVAASGTVVLIPEIPEWSRLEVAPAITVPTIRDAVLALDARDDVADGRAGVVGFSFGATQALMASVDPSLEGHLQAVAAWGGYCDVHALFRFGLFGEHAWGEERYRIEPDPYGRWVMGANYLTGVPGFEERSAVAAALRVLAVEAGESGIGAWDPRFDASKVRLRERLDPEDRATFDLFAPPTGAPPPDRAYALATARELADAALRTDPLLDPAPFLPRVHVRTLLAHGRDDRLVPFTAMYRLRQALPDEVVVGSGLTALFAHSGGAAPELGIVGTVREGVRFLSLLNGILKLV